MKTTEPGAHGQPIEITAHADAALRTVRVVLAVLSILLLGAYRPLVGPPSWISLTATLAVIIAALAALNAVSLRMPDSGRWAALLQALDVVAATALAVALDEPLDHQSWVLLVVPVVSAAVRFGAMASMLSWIGGCAGYLAAAYVGAIGANADVGLVTRVPGTLLAVAITIGILARWMREGWEIQNEVTEVIADRERRLAVLEQTRHALTNTEPDEALTLCARQALALGFAAVTVQHLGQDSPFLVVGQGDIVAATDPPQHDASHGPVVTAWTDGAQILSRSVTAHEPQTDTLIGGWSRAPIEHDQVRALATLVAITSDSIETATLLRQLRYAANHDSRSRSSTSTTSNTSVGSR